MLILPASRTASIVSHCLVWWLRFRVSGHLRECHLPQFIHPHCCVFTRGHELLHDSRSSGQDLSHCNYQTLILKGVALTHRVRWVGRKEPCDHDPKWATILILLYYLATDRLWHGMCKEKGTAGKSGDRYGMRSEKEDTRAYDRGYGVDGGRDGHTHRRHNHMCFPVCDSIDRPHAKSAIPGTIV